MSNRLKMAEAQAILTLARLGWSYRRIAAEVGVDRETVSRHVKAAVISPSIGMSGDSPIGEAAESNATISITGSGSVMAHDAADAPKPDAGGVGHEEPAADPSGSNAAISIAGSEELFQGAAAGRRSRCEPWRAIIV